MKSRNYAVFGQATYRFSDMFALTGGLRYTKDELDYTHTRAPAVLQAGADSVAVISDLVGHTLPETITRVEAWRLLR